MASMFMYECHCYRVMTYRHCSNTWVVLTNQCIRFRTLIHHNYLHLNTSISTHAYFIINVILLCLILLLFLPLYLTGDRWLHYMQNNANTWHNWLQWILISFNRWINKADRCGFDCTQRGKRMKLNILHFVLDQYTNLLPLTSRIDLCQRLTVLQDSWKMH